MMRSNKKLTNPDFPVLPDDQISSSIHSTQFLSPIPSLLEEQIEGFQSRLKIIRLNKLSIASENKAGMDSVFSMLYKLENTITSPAWIEDGSNSVKDQLMMDLLRVLNQTLSKTLASKSLETQDLALIREIGENLWELLFPVIHNQAQSLENRQPRYWSPSVEAHVFYASLEALPGSVAFPGKREGLSQDGPGKK